MGEDTYQDPVHIWNTIYHGMVVVNRRRRAGISAQVHNVYPVMAKPLCDVMSMKAESDVTDNRK